LIEEYSVAAQIFKLSGTDLCELARNSVLQSGFEMSLKKRWVGDTCHLLGPDGNDIQKTNVPNIRLAYRYQTLMEERFMVLGGRMSADICEEEEMEASTHSEFLNPVGMEAYPDPMVKVGSGSPMVRGMSPSGGMPPEMKLDGPMREMGLGKEGETMR
jgi:hypothetical protein